MSQTAGNHHQQRRSSNKHSCDITKLIPSLPFSDATLVRYGCPLPLGHRLLRAAHDRLSKTIDTGLAGLQPPSYCSSPASIVDQLLPIAPAFNEESTRFEKSDDPSLFLKWFHPVGFLGRGSFGEVLLVQYRPSPKYFFAAKSADPNDKASMAEWSVATTIIGAALPDNVSASTVGAEDQHVLRYLCCLPAVSATKESKKHRRDGVIFLVTELAPFGSLVDAPHSLGFHRSFDDSGDDVERKSEETLTALPPRHQRRPSHQPLNLPPPSSTMPIDQPWRVLRLFAQAVSGLACLHRRNVLHRDIKPANMLLCRATIANPLSSGHGVDGNDDRGTLLNWFGNMERLVLGDFGISKSITIPAAADAAGSAAMHEMQYLRAASSSLVMSPFASQNSFEMSATADRTNGHQQRRTHDAGRSNPNMDMHTVIGTLAYAAPEVLEHWGTSPTAEYGAAADVFSLGAVFYCWVARNDLTTGLIRGPQDASMLLNGQMPKLVDLRSVAMAHRGDSHPSTIPMHAVPAHLAGSVTSVSLSASMIQQKHEAAWLAEGQRALCYPLELLQAIDDMMQVDPFRRPTAQHVEKTLFRHMMPPSTSSYILRPIQQLMALGHIDSMRFTRWMPVAHCGGRWVVSVLQSRLDPRTTLLWFASDNLSVVDSFKSAIEKRRAASATAREWLSWVRRAAAPASAADKSSRASDILVLPGNASQDIVITDPSVADTHNNGTRQEVVVVFRALPPISQADALLLIAKAAALKMEGST